MNTTPSTSNKEVLSANIVTLTGEKLIGEFVLDVSTNEQVITFSYIKIGNKVSFNSHNQKQNLFFSLTVSDNASNDDLQKEIKQKFPPQFLEVVNQ